MRESLFQLTDAYSLFYYNFLNNKKAEKGSWLQNLDSPKIRAWSGYAFEMIALKHLDKIKETLGISSVQTEISSWVCTKKETNARIDLIIDRRDQVINLFEIKYSLDNYLITSKYAKELRHKIAVFQRETKTKKAIYFTMLTTYGLFEDEHSGMVQNSLTTDNLF